MNQKFNSIKLSYLKKYLDLGDWGVETKFQPLRPERLNKP